MNFRLLPFAWLLAAGCFYSFDNPVEQQPTGSISGQVSLVSPAPGQTPAGGSVSVLWSALSLPLTASGQFLLLGLPSGAYSLVYRVPPADDAGNDLPLFGELPDLQLPDIDQQSDALALGSIQLTVSGTVGGVVSGAQGAAVVSSFVPLADGGVGSFEGFSAEVQGDGSYALTLPAGSHALVAADLVQVSVVSASAVQPGQSTTTNFALAIGADGGGDVKGELVFGYPASDSPGGTEAINALAAGTQFVATASDGSLVADGGLPLQGDVAGVGDAFDLPLPSGQLLTVTLLVTSSPVIPDGGAYPPLVLPGITTSPGLATVLGQVTWLTDSQLCVNGIGCPPPGATTSSSGTGNGAGSASSGSASTVSGSGGSGVSGSGGSGTGSGSGAGGSSSGTGSAPSPWGLVAQSTGFDAGGEPLTVNALPGPNGEPAIIFTASNMNDPNLYFWTADGGPPVAIFDAGGPFYFISTGWANNGARSAAVVENAIGSTQVVMKAVTQTGGVWSPVPITTLPISALETHDGTYGMNSIVYDPLTLTPWLIESPRNLANYHSFVAAPLNGSGALYEAPTDIRGVPQYLTAIPCTNPWDGGAVICVAYISGTNSLAQLALAIFDPSAVADGGDVAPDSGVGFQVIDLIPEAGDAGFLELKYVALTNSDNRAITLYLHGEAPSGADLDLWSTFVPGVAAPTFNVFPSADGGSYFPTLVTWQNQPLLMLWDPQEYFVGGARDADLLFFLDASDGGSLAATPSGLGATSPPAAYVDATGDLVAGLNTYDREDGGSLSLVVLPP